MSETATVTTPTPTTPTADPSAFAPAGTAAPAAATPSQPTVDTSPSEYDKVSTYVPQLKEGTHAPLCKILDFGPATNKETGDFMGWSVSLALAEDAVDEFGGKLPVGHRLDRLTIFTTKGTYRSDDECARAAKANLMGLNNIIRDKKADHQYKQAEAAFNALPATQKRPGRLDTNPANYQQWIGTVVRAVLVSKVKDSELRVNCNGFLAKDTPARS